jgi:hypothetical protein
MSAATVTAANTPAAQAAYAAFMARQVDRRAAEACTGDNVYECPCAGCMAYVDAEIKAERDAEDGYVRYLENLGEPCRGIMALDGGCMCC